VKLTLTGPRPLRFMLDNLRSPYGGIGRWRTQLPLWLRGFTADQVALYGITPNAASEYLPDYRKYKITLNTNRNVWPILHDKLLFDAFAPGRLPTSRLLALSSAGTFTWLTNAFDESTLAAELRAGGGFVVKPLRGGGGVGLTFVTPSAGGRVLIGGSEHDASSFVTWLAGLPYHGLYRREPQHSVVGEFYPRTTNTMRISFFRRDGHEPALLDASLRVGVVRSEPVDNTGQGAATVRLDEAGVTVEAHVLGRNGAYQAIDKHPDTGQDLLGVKLPYWRDTIDLLTEFHRRNPAFDLVGWDVLLAPTGPLIIEGNHNPHLRAAFLHGTFATRPEFLAFCREKGLVGPHSRS